MAINFEDLFDFSPQGDQPDTEDIDTYVEKTAQSLFRPAAKIPTSTRQFLSARDATTFKLSASLPTSNLSASYTGSSSPGSSGGSFGFRRVSHNSGDSNGQSFLDELVGASASTNDIPASGAEVKSKRGRKPGQRSISVSGGGVSLKSEMKNKLERSRQSARECRARKKLRYQYLDDLILEREKANTVLREELLKYQVWCHKLDKGEIPEGLEEAIHNLKKSGVGPQKN